LDLVIGEHGKSPKFSTLYSILFPMKSKESKR
jgi:hypothetical protein